MPLPDLSQSDLKRAVSLVTQMMAIRGPSGQEGRILNFIHKRLRAAGVPASVIQTDTVHRRSHLGGEAGNLIVKLPGTARRPRRLLMAHVDTVPVCLGSRPVRRGDVIRSADRSTGLGADNRSGAAAILNALLVLAQRKLDHPPLTVLFPVQEEVGLHGARLASLTQLGRPRLAFNFDGGCADQIVVGATGAYRMTIEIEGVASHAGMHPEDGVSAIAIAALATTQLQRDGWHGAVSKGRQRGTTNLGRIEGGSATNVVAPRATIWAEARSHDPRFRKRILAAITKSFQDAARKVRNASGQCGHVSIESHLDYESFRLGSGETCVTTAEQAIQSIGGEPYRVVVDGGLDANWLVTRGLPTVTLGAGQHHAHTVDEYLDVPQFEAGCRVAFRLATGGTG